AVDMGEVNGRTFLNNSSLGLYPTIVVRRQREQLTGKTKWNALFWATLDVLRHIPLLNVRVSADGGTMRWRTPFVFLGNNEYEIQGLNIGTRASLDAGHLFLYIASPETRFQLF